MTLHAIPGSATVQRLARAIATSAGWGSERGDVVVFAIRGDDRLPTALVDLLPTLVGRTASFVVVGDFSRPPDARHQVWHGLREWTAGAPPEAWVTWVDTPLDDPAAAAAGILASIRASHPFAPVASPVPVLHSDEAFEQAMNRSHTSVIDLRDGSPYGRSLLTYLSGRRRHQVLSALSSSEATALDLGWVGGPLFDLVLPETIRAFRATGASALGDLLLRRPPLEELVLVGGGLPSIALPPTTASALLRLILDKNALFALPDVLSEAPLTVLSVLRNRFTRVPQVVRGSATLRSLTIGCNPIRELDAWLGELEALEALDLSNLDLDRSPEAELAPLWLRGAIVRTDKLRVRDTSWNQAQSQAPTRFPALGPMS